MFFSPSFPFDRITDDYDTKFGSIWNKKEELTIIFYNKLYQIICGILHTKNELNLKTYSRLFIIDTQWRTTMRDGRSVSQNHRISSYSRLVMDSHVHKCINLCKINIKYCLLWILFWLRRISSCLDYVIKFVLLLFY